ncbi:low-density lipoprotein receptor-related protein 3-like isoform X2 [Littorina saxatilis]
MSASFLCVLSAMFVCVSGHYPSYEYLKKYCGRQMTFTHSLLLGYDRHTNIFPANFKCGLHLRTPDLGWRVQVTLLDLNTKMTPGCHLVSLHVIGDVIEKHGVCGREAPKVLYRTQHSSVDILLRTGLLSTWGDFQLLFTSYYDSTNGSCMRDDFRCNNGLCISTHLTCNGYNDCGDGSDEMLGGCDETVDDITSILVVCIITQVIVCFALGQCLFRRRLTLIRVLKTTGTQVCSTVLHNLRVVSLASKPFTRRNI